MRLLQSVPLLPFAGVCAAQFAAEPQYVFANPPASESAYKIPTSYESAVLGRRVLALTPLGTLSTVFPGSSSSSSASSSSSDVDAEERRPGGLAGMPIGLMDYVADCEDSGDPTVLAIKIATSFRNVAEGSNISLSMQWAPPYPPDKRIQSAPPSLWNWLFGGDDKEEPVPYSAANLPRFSLIGYLEKIGEDEASSAALASCFVDAHPDAKYWLPGNRIHSSEFVRLVVTQVYWIGGFGDRAFIGWIPVDEWKNVTRAEWEDVRLPGEKKHWKEWSVQDL